MINLMVLFLMCISHGDQSDSIYDFYNESKREDKMLFGTGASLIDYDALREKLDHLEAVADERIHKLETRFFPTEGELSDPEEEILFRQTDELAPIKSNITNLYTKVKALRAANSKKCSKKKCDNIRDKVKKMNMQLKMLDITALQASINTINTLSSTLESRIVALESKVAALETTTSTQQTDIDANKVVATDVTKIKNCFADINSADCPSARRRKSRDLINETIGSLIEDNIGEESDEVDDQNDKDDPSQILKHIFRASREEKVRKNKKKKKTASSRQTTTPLIPELKAIMSCMTDNTASACTAKYR